ncbi:hypothetical protein HanRHA438_Chr17g0818991 [Helianthus annuus]|nr:hypothetical protein HanIR_Chr17g0878231 [Helianthus annuus]KAJ0447986.1 hypothetical protein HanHA89_Chr17g0711561 [Helianthus annuus]KAJ0632879.1 hypothetical protein HanLR1_Chr17g0670131 [Helianthus annuus]KAJ0636707.1 hypothetical protein HanOQP8_Chr17g0665061 [Helianthus annuus]KAJ0668136.1 hypothetical protein HanPI659440_Chr17g0685621 [Helianthus annuus]
MQPSNLESFIDSTTPVLPSRSLPKSEVMKLNRLWHPFETEEVEFFTLSDVWNRFDEWSAYGAGVPVNIGEEDEMIVQYYVPYLSAIQIFTSSSTLNYLREETDSETRDSFSDSFSDDSESEKLSRWDGCSSDEGVFDQDSPLHFNDRLGYLYFQYFERSAPYERVPLLDKICMFSQKYPGLMSLRSVDLSPASWMAVAWYPIYHIPMGRTIKDLSTCFLTYHTLSSSFQDADDTDNEYQNDASKKKNKEEVGIRLRAFGMATYKMQGDVWISGGNGKDQEKLVSLLNVAGCWLKQLNVQHHDFNYFMRCHQC